MTYLVKTLEEKKATDKQFKFSSLSFRVRPCIVAIKSDLHVGNTGPS